MEYEVMVKEDRDPEEDKLMEEGSMRTAGNNPSLMTILGRELTDQMKKETQLNATTADQNTTT